MTKNSRQITNALRLLSSKKKLAFLRTMLVLSLAAVVGQKSRVQILVGAATAESSRTNNDLTIIEHAGGVVIESSVQNKAFASASTTTHAAPTTAEEDILVVVAVDGTVAGISRSTGEILWKQQQQNHPSATTASGKMQPRAGWSVSDGDESSEAGVKAFLKPLLSTTTTTQSAASSDYAAVPSIDGNVYLTVAGNNKGVGEATTTFSTSVKELVQRAPFLDPQGRFFVGSRQTTAVALDAQSGELLRVVSSSDGSKEDDDKRLGEWNKDRSIVWIGRVDYSVTVQDARTGIKSVQFGISEIQGVQDLHGRGRQDATSKSAAGGGDGTRNGGVFWDEHLKSLPDGSILANENTFQPHDDGDLILDSTRLVSTPSGNLALVHPETGKVQWVASEQFHTPIAYFLTDGQSLPVDIVPDVTVPSSNDLGYLSRELERQVQLFDNTAFDDNFDDAPHQTIVGRLEGSGQLYALPLGRKRSSSSSGTASTFRPHAATNHHHHAAAIASNAAARHKTVPQLIGGTTRLSQSHQHHEASGAESSRKPCHPTSPHFPSCLVDHHKHQPPRLEYFAKGADNKFMSEGLPPRDETTTQHGLALVAKNQHHQEHFRPESVVYHPDYGYVVDPQLFTARPQPPRSSKIFKILGSWLPPTIALIFVLSFELGRRKRLKDESGAAKGIMVPNNGTTTEPVTEASGDGDVSMPVESAESSAIQPPPSDQQQLQQQQQQHVIQVSDQVLGYGGQGTVVYKGVLDGREVAVKRMLKAYHASADREIRLLIESDGHPNVVRYFLKEVRGDFVYLALELCDLSLHDLIGVLRTTTSGPEALIPSIPIAATKIVLQQIASGVRHLHSLRIVHRDLKPANILLAITKSGKKKVEKQKASTLETFLDGSYVAKISDMGLGKQIVGQSSLGASFMATPSFQGTKGGTSSVGVGPGSVGWQAPEVMALRWVASDASARSGESTNPESSPIDLPSPNPRTSRSVDIFSLGCIFYSTLVPGHHPFGEWYEREANIVHNRPSMAALENISPDAYQLVRSMLSRDPKMRPTAKQICEHPFFWTSQKKLSFLCEFSDRLETDTSVPTSIQQISSLAIERGAVDVVGTSWDEKLDEPLISNMQRFRTYDPSSVRDLLRLIRNKHHHFDELPENFRATRVASQDALLEYFEQKFPRLMMHCWSCCRTSLTSDDLLMTKYEVPPLPCKAEPSKPLLVAAPAPESAEVESASEGKQDMVEPPELEDGDSVSKTGGEAVEEAFPEEQDEDWGFEKLPDEAEIQENLQETFTPVEPVVFETPFHPEDANDVIAWEGSTAAKELNCRGWSRSDAEWARRIDPAFRKKDPNLKRAIEDPKFRTRLCNHWDESMGTFCPMRKRNKCVFAHGPVELRVKEGKKNRWGKLVDKNGDCKNPRHSGGEDTYGAARSIETTRKEEGKWNTNAKGAKGKKPAGGITKKKKPQQSPPD